MVVDKESCCLRLPEYAFWYRALLENNFTKLQEILQKSTEPQRNKLINNPFVFDSMDSKHLPLTKQISRRFQIKYPIHLVATLGHEQSFDVLVDSGANIFIKDDCGNNILHLLCYTANANSEKEGQIKAFFKHLLKRLSQSEVNLLLTQKNELDWNPEVTAISLGELGIFLDMFMSKGLNIYLSF